MAWWIDQSNPLWFWEVELWERILFTASKPPEAIFNNLHDLFAWLETD